MVQRRAVRFVCDIRDRGETSITKERQDLGWPTLQTRRQAKRLSIFHKAVNGLIAVDIDATVATRSSRRQHTKCFIRPNASCDAYAQSFTPRTIRDWNGLPDYITSIEDPESFKEAIQEFLGVQ